MYKEIICNMFNIREAYRKAHRGKTDAADVIAFDEHRMYNMNKLLKKLEDKAWDEVFVYYRFVINEPKERIVDALTFEGRIVQHIICDEILRPYFERRLVKENCACRVGKGTDYAMRLAKQGLANYLKTHSDGYVLKMDVKKYFPSIDRDVLKNMLAEFPDAEMLEMLYWIIDHCPDSNGLPIGNQTSQWFALYYLDAVDRTIKEKYHIKYYVRYMDDLIVIHESKELLQDLLSTLRVLAKETLKLEFNGKTQIVPLHKGFSFLGWRYIYTDTNKVVMKVDAGKRKFRVGKIREIQKARADGAITEEEYSVRMMSVRVNLLRGNTYGFREAYKVPRK